MSEQEFAARLTLLESRLDKLEEENRKTHKSTFMHMDGSPVYATTIRQLAKEQRISPVESLRNIYKLLCENDYLNETDIMSDILVRPVSASQQYRRKVRKSQNRKK
jgi:hypothetical protein